MAWVFYRKRNLREKDYMKVLLVDVDSRIPNLALMKLSAWHRGRGDEVELIKYDNIRRVSMADFDKIYVSCVFSWNAPKIRWIARLYPQTEIGGHGYNGAKLPPKAEHIMPDYSLYDCDFSMGFTSRGCFRRCDFCDVWRLEGNFHEHAPIEEFWNPRHDKIVFVDNVFNASELMEDKLHFCKEHGLKVSITQGIDARLVTREQAKIIARHWPYYSWKFNDTVLYTAWDRLEDEDLVLGGIRNLIDAGVPARRIMLYMLVGYDTNLDQDMYRFRKLRRLGVLPYVMPFDNRPHPMKRWGNRPAIFKRHELGDYWYA